MSKLVSLNKEYQPGANFWELNPQLILMPPFAGLYIQDNSKDKEYSSKQMWCIFFMKEPDEDANKFFRFGEEKVKEMLTETWFQDADWWDNEMFKQCADAYPNMCLNAVERSFYSKKKMLEKLANFLEHADFDEDNVAKFVSAHSKIPKIYEEYEKIEEKFMKSKTSGRVKGGRQQTKAELGEV